MDPIAPNTSNPDVSTPVIDYNDLIGAPLVFSIDAFLDF